jgi:hypothetical protein
MTTSAKWLIALLLTAGSTEANAALIYNYAADFMYDSSTGLYWQIGSVPTSTFLPDGSGQVAGAQQLGQLLNEVGADSFSQAAYSSQIANLVAFFSTDAPAPPASSNIPAENYQLPWTAYSTGTTFNYMTVGYSGGPATAQAIDWAFSENATVGAYGPAMPYPYCGVGLWPACGSTAVNAFLISDAAPIPLSASAWQMLLGLGVLGGMLRWRAQRPAGC